MVRILIIALISLCFSALKIYADCDLPTGGACSIEALKKEQQHFSKFLNEDKYLNQLDTNYAQEQEKRIKKDAKIQQDVNNNLEKKFVK